MKPMGRTGSQAEGDDDLRKLIEETGADEFMAAFQELIDEGLVMYDSHGERFYRPDSPPSNWSNQ